MARNPCIVFMLGPPASGKGTLGKRLAEDFGFYHLSVGDYLRYLINGPLADQADIVDAVRSGGTRGLVRGDVIVSLLVEKMKIEMSRGKSGFLFDGFARNLEQNEAFTKMMRAEFNVGCTRALRLPKQDILFGKREDDSGDLFDKRFSDYENRDSKVVELYRKQLVKVSHLNTFTHCLMLTHKLQFKVDGTMSIEESHREMKMTLVGAPFNIIT
ncbi:UMP-CMP kinase [Lachnellula suecica]|uniref:UMP-CMP kinase n=1 Tax=Lachnellula suecica TaxID=602035 RepID=A0A8T9C310_9HELO|nr:UMP-CMP kinase [Lachnellula suecica]